MKLYPHKTPIILTDDVFISHGGQTGTSTDIMRTVAYQIAEQQMTNYIDTFLLPTGLTGSADYFPGRGFIATDYGYVSELGFMRAVDRNGIELFRLTGTHSYALIKEDTYGYLYVDDICRGYRLGQPPIRFEYAYVAGLPTGEANQPGMLMALAKAAQIILNELYEVTLNESTGDVGVTKFTSLGYTEERKGWKNTAFGSSPAAAFIARLVDATVKKARRMRMFGGS